MKNIFLALLCASLLFVSCKSNKEKASASSTGIKDDAEATHSAYQDVEPTFPSKSTSFKISNFENEQFYVTVFYTDTSFKFPIRWYLDQKDITREIYDDIKSRENAIFEVWTTKKGKVTDVLLMDKPPSKGARSVWIANQFPINARSSD